MGTATAFEPIVRPIANAAKPPSGPGDLSQGRPRHPRRRRVHGVRLRALRLLRAHVRAVLRPRLGDRSRRAASTPTSARSWRAARSGTARPSTRMLVCTTCEVCNTRCQLQLPIEHNWMEMRGKLINEEKRGTFPPFEMMAASLRGENDIWAGKRENRDDMGARGRRREDPGAVRHHLLRRLHGELRRDRHRRGVDPPAPGRRLRGRLHGQGRGLLRHPDEGRRQVGPVRGDLRAQRRRGPQARREDDRDLVPGVRPGVEGALRQPRRRARRGVRVRGQALLGAGRARRSPRASSSSRRTRSRARRSRSTTRATPVARRASTSRRATCSRRSRASTRRDGAQPRRGPVLRLGADAHRRDRRSRRSSAGTACRKRSTPARTPSSRCAPAARSSCATPTSRTTSACSVDDLVARRRAGRGLRHPRDDRDTRCTCGASSTSSST